MRREKQSRHSSVETLSHKRIHMDELSQPLYNAIKAKEVAAVRDLLHRGASPNSRFEDVPVLRTAVTVNHYEIFKMLLADGADVDAAPEKDRGTALMTASLMGLTDFVELLIRHGANLDLQADTGGTALFCAALFGHTQIAKILLANGASPLIEGFTEKSTALHMAAMRGHATTCRLLIDHGCAVNQARRDGFTALAFAAQCGSLECTSVLLKLGADATMSAVDGMTPLCFAARRSPPNADLCKLLIESGAPVQSQLGLVSPLHCAVGANQPEICKLLLMNGADPLAVHKGAILGARTPLEIAANFPQPGGQVVYALLKRALQGLLLE
eukprot:TRINITY_DN11145_c0_g1_i1.p1 TRINITY_DN11145_c0_g1~~TRINITY_DN11145_c0_g1_i1.p1  ORF type:complete len:328 (+),score=61.17 TRINITY_DN11145_c0_g1_i1:88-1071(+)